MAITIRERPNRNGTLGHPLPVEVDLSLVDPAPITYSIELGFDGRLASQVFGFQLSRRAEISLAIKAVANDPYVVHVHTSLTDIEKRTYMSVPADGTWTPIEKGDWRLIFGITIEEMIDLEVTIAIRPRRVWLLAPVICQDCGTTGLISPGVPDPVIDDRTLARWSLLDYSLDLIGAPGSTFTGDFTGATGVLQIWNGDLTELAYEVALDPAALAGNVLAATIRAWRTGNWPAPAQARAFVTLPGRPPLLVMRGTWTVEEGEPIRLYGRPALDDLVLQRHEDHTYRLQVHQLLTDSSPTLPGWIGDCDVWNGDPIYNVRWGTAPADGAAIEDGVMIFEFPSAVTTTWPDRLEMRAWLTDPDGGIHWIARGDWDISQGYTRYAENIVRDDRVVQRRENFLYEALLLQDGNPMELAGGVAILRLSRMNGAPIGGVADAPFVCDPLYLADGIISTVISDAVTALLPDEVAMRVFIDLPDGRTGILAMAGVWTVSEGYSD